ncbi:MalY/PatB family protein [Edwardsiella piscicida]|uniref:MalY/PatB family protein n=1 Tax=Edwardsiella piscicida TaxID=1263550 RepID=UPI0002C1558D|nr:PatB family C-S lyase [Edwardsiella piscicida]AGH73461.1 aminotransferase [Edwardsiella piscicida C07-087]AOP42764.1 PatB family C-S lyase [Edwardsiella piscicida]EKS7767416.1 PatB family C-S lyase [Edwardsiella piscicida]EKS7779144.1 PatB family C-S lyase [Edwardsiella piscicida]EKS7782564.1 PatB family C-S lyase [Edwardsiella piscicida]
MTFNFDEVIDRRHSDSEKWGKYAEQDTIPLWVADSDFRSPPAVIDALQARVAHGVFGYGMVPPALIELFVARMAQRYRWAIQPDWLVFLPGLVCGLNLTVRALTTPAQSTLAPHPIYPPFMKSARLAGRAQTPMPMALRHGRWVVSLDEAEAALRGDERLLMLCNPQNPGGTVYHREELEAQLAFAQRHDLLICSDEIHCDLLLEPGIRHTPIAALSDDAAQRSVTLMAPSKTFNIAGLGASIAIIPNAELRRRFIDARAGIVPQVDILAFAAAEAAYRHGQPWLDAQLDYLRANRDRVTARINAIPGLHTVSAAGTYLAWIDASELPVDNPQAFFERAGVGLSDGADFGAPRFIRLNFACRRALLDRALDRMADAVARL